jgi:hypothetical protein
LSLGRPSEVCVTQVVCNSDGSQARPSRKRREPHVVWPCPCEVAAESQGREKNVPNSRAAVAGVFYCPRCAAPKKLTWPRVPCLRFVDMFFAGQRHAYASVSMAPQIGIRVSSRHQPRSGSTTRNDIRLFLPCYFLDRAPLRPGNSQSIFNWQADGCIIAATSMADARVISMFSSQHAGAGRVWPTPSPSSSFGPEDHHE